MQEKEEKNSKLLQWHQAFYAGIQIELKAYAKALIFENEHMLSTKPMQIDVLVVKKEPQIKIEKNIGRIFRTYNIIEYKSPTDRLSIDDFYKVYGYGCFYKSDAVAVDQISIGELTLTFVCYHYPRRLAQHLEKTRGWQIVPQETGIYYVLGDLMPIQLIIVPELTDEKNLWLHGLTNRIAASETATQLINEYEEHRQNRLYESVMEIVVQSNRTKFQEVDSMCHALFELFEDQLKDMARQMAEQMVEPMAKEMAEPMAKEMAEPMAKEMAEPMAKEMAEPMAKEMAEPMAKEMAEPMAKEMAEPIAKEMAGSMMKELTERRAADIFANGETATLLSQIEKKIRKNKPLSMIADELEETEDVILPLYKQVNALLAAQA